MIATRPRPDVADRAGRRTCHTARRPRSLRMTRRRQPVRADRPRASTPESATRATTSARLLLLERRNASHERCRERSPTPTWPPSTTKTTAGRYLGCGTNSTADVYVAQQPRRTPPLPRRRSRCLVHRCRRHRRATKPRQTHRRRRSETLDRHTHRPHHDGARRRSFICSEMSTGETVAGARLPRKQ